MRNSKRLMTRKITVQLLLMVMIVSCLVLVACSNSNIENGNELSKQSKNNIIYENNQYGFEFILPDSWRNYTVVNSEWEGQILNDNEKSPIIGPIISIRHPEWTEENPRQDIPIMIVLVEQWDLIKNENLIVSAAPVPPTELGRNSKYVFALPARYNFAYLTGYEEVDDIINKPSLKPTENINIVK